MLPQNPYPKHQKGYWAEFIYKGNKMDQIKIVRGSNGIEVSIYMASGANNIIWETCNIRLEY